ncbi:hypothetical protein BHF71_10970 [Vulcanibacillus modesticaldus]|uniref:Amidohydrolase-related domain-containing protein n=1 Tax=Vulcanibacillus modesticaldus TaxID=337097 RepID=A0A1D2YSN0_9BACI|nr:hypothetical protein [Vulcanibacillus modesticaldus]OEF97633.1 hypothetical protein BHF71_10970 [Vulcanibacillus modesticaldus]
MEIIDIHVHSLPCGTMNSGKIDVRYETGIERIRNVFEQIGYNKIFFGSDFPTENIDDQIEIIKEIVPIEYQKKVFSKNVRNFGKQFNWWV